ncbi:MAG: AarF/UbiB family protein [Coriobacteriia bacterium]|nr:AarF/UbiB family protein [Coriobacteriia bacterium]
MNARKRRRQIFWIITKHWWRAAVESRFGFVGITVRREVFARELRFAFEKLGPAFIKLGQLISIRPDMFPPQYVFEMENLRDSVTPTPFEEMKPVFEEELGKPAEELFESINPIPIGSASIAQVYKAKLAFDYKPVIGEVLPAGTDLAIKMVRPGSEEKIRGDIAAVTPLVNTLHKLKPLKRFNMPQLLQEFADSITSEIDLRVEGRTSDRFAFDFIDDPYVTTATIVWPQSSKSILTMQFVEGWHLHESDQATAAGVDARFLAIHGADVFMKQVMVVGRFHADMHQSNLLLTPGGKICYIDFGIMGEVKEEHKEAIAQILAATVYADAKRAIQYSADIGLIVRDSEREEVIGKVSALMKRTFSKSPRDVRGFAIGFLSILNEQRVVVPRGFGLLVKALVVVEGCAQTVYDDIDIVEAAETFTTELVLKHMLRPARLYKKLPLAIDAAINELIG